jgi:fibronectin-binding autotransporter adhesin
MFERLVKSDDNMKSTRCFQAARRTLTVALLPFPASERTRKARQRRACWLIAAALGLIATPGLERRAQAQQSTTFNQGATNGVAVPVTTTNFVWNNTNNWTNGIPTSASTTTAIFGAASGTLGTAFTNFDDISGNLNLGQLQYNANGNGTNTASTITTSILGNNTITLNGATGLNLTAVNAAAVTIVGNLALGASTTFNNASGQLLTVSGSVNLGASTLIIAGTPYSSGGVTFGNQGLTGTTGSLVVGGSSFGSIYTGTVTINSTVANTFTGGITVASGTLTVDSSNVITPINSTASLLSSSNALTLGSASTYTGGTITFKSNATVATAQTLASLSLADGQNTITLTANTLNPTLTFTGTTWARSNFATINLTAPAGTTVSTPTSTVTSSSLVTAPWITINAGNFVVNSSGVLVAPTYASGTNQNMTTWTTTGPGLDQQYTTGTVSMTTSGAFANSLNFTPAANTVLELPASSTTTITTGGIFSGLGAFTKVIQPLSGTATIVPGGTEWVIQNTTAAGNTLTITTVMGNGSGTTNLTVGGASTGVTILTPATNNLFSGAVTINTGQLRLGSVGALASVPTSSVQINYSGALSVGYAITQGQLTTLQGQINPNSTGVFGLFATADGGALNFSMAATPNLSFGATGATTYTGTLTPNAVSATAPNSLTGNAYTGQYLLGGGGATLTMGNTNALTSSNQVIFNYNGTAAGAVTLTGANNYSGGTVLGAAAGTFTATAGPSGLGTGGILFANSNTLVLTAAGALNQGVTINDLFVATINMPTASEVITVSTNPITGSGGLTVTGVNATPTTQSVLLLNIANTYGGLTTITTGTIELGLKNAIPVTSELAIANTANVGLTMNGFNQQVGGLVTGGAALVGNTGVLLSTGSTLTVQNVASVAWAGGINGSGNVIINAGFYTNTALGAFTQTFTGQNSFTGTLTLNSGTLSVTSGNQLGSGTANTIQLNSGILLFAQTAALGGTSTTNTQNFVVGVGTTVNTGLLSTQIIPTLEVAASQTVTLNGTLTFNAGATLQTQGNGIVQSGTTILSGAATLTNISGSVTLGGVTNSSGTFTFGGVGAISVGAISGGSGGLSINAIGVNSQLATTVSPASNNSIEPFIGGLGSVTLTSSSSFTGIINVAGGDLIISATNQLSSNTSSSSLTLSGGNLAATASVSQSSGGTLVSGNSSISVASSATVSLNALSIGSYSLNANGPGNLTVSGTTTLTSAGSTVAVSTSAINNYGSGTVTLGAITNGANNLALGGTGNFTLSTLGSGSGGFTVNTSGAVGISNAVSNTGFFTVTSGTVTLSSTAAVGALTVNGGSLTLSGAATSGTLSGTGGTFTVSTSLGVTQSSNTTFAGVLAGSGSFTLASGSGILTLSGANTQSGGIIINAGTLAFATDSGGAANPLGAAANALTLGGGTLLDTATATVNRGITLTTSTSSFLSASPGMTLTVSGGLTGSGGLTIGGSGNTGIVVLSNGANSSAFSGTLTVGSGATLSLGSTSVGTSGGYGLAGGTLNVASFSSSSALSVSGNSSVGGTGGAQFTTLALANGSTLNVSNSGSITFSGATTITGAATISNVNSGSNGISLAAVTTGSGAFTLFSTSTSSNSVIGGNITGNGSLVYTNPAGGTLTLSGTNTYAGTTTVNYGNLTVNSSATLPSTPSALTLAGGTVTMNATASQSFGALTLNTGASTISVGSGSTLTIGNSWTPNSGGTVNFTGSGTLNSAPAASGVVIGGYATVAGTDWASTNGTSIVAFTGYTTAGATTAWAASGPGQDLSYGVASAPSSGTFADSVRFTAASAVTLTAATTYTITTGGILVQSGDAGAASFATATAKITSSAGQLYIQNYGSGGLTIAPILTGNIGVTLSGTGTTTFSTANTFTGALTLNGGTLVLASAGESGSGSLIVLNGGTLSVSTTTTLSQAVNVNANVTLNSATTGVFESLSGTVTVANGVTLTTTSPASNTGGWNFSGVFAAGANTTINNDSLSTGTTKWTGPYISASGPLTITTFGAAAAVTTISPTSGTVFAPGAANALTLNILSGAGAVTDTTATIFSGPATFTVNNSGSAAPTIATALTLGGTTTITAANSNATATATTLTGAITAGGNSLILQNNGTASGSTLTVGAPTFTTPAALIATGSNTPSSLATNITVGAIALTGPASLTVLNNSTSANAQLALGAIISPNAGAGVSLIFGGNSANTIAPAAITFSQPGNITVLANGPTVTTTGTFTTAGNGNTVITNNSGNTLTFNGVTVLAGGPVLFAGSGTIAATTLTSATNVPIVLTGSGNVNVGTLTMTGAATYIANTGTGTLTITGTGTNNGLVISGSGKISVSQVTYSAAEEIYMWNTGATTISNINMNAAALLTFFQNSTTTVTLGGYTNSGATANTITFTGVGMTNWSGAYAPGATGSITVNPGAGNAGGVILGGANSTQTVSNSTITLTTGQIQFSTASNLPTGALTLTAGVFNNQAPASTGTINIANATTFGGAIINVQNTGNTLVFPSMSFGNLTQVVAGAGGVNFGNVTGTGATTNTSVFNNNSTGGVTIGTITGPSFASAGTYTFQFIGSGATTVTGVIAGNTNDTTGVNIAGTGVNLGNNSILNTLTGSGGNSGSVQFGATLGTSVTQTYTGGTTIQAGTLNVTGGSGAVGAATGQLTIVGGTLSITPATSASSTTTVATLQTSGNATLAFAATGATNATTLAVTGALQQNAASLGSTIIFNTGNASLVASATTTGQVAISVGTAFTQSSTGTQTIGAPWAVAQIAGSGSTDATFITGANNFVGLSGIGAGATNYTQFAASGAVATANIYSTGTSGTTTVTTSEAMYALQVASTNNSLTVNSGQTLTIGVAAGLGGLIINGGTTLSPTTIGGPGTIAFGTANAYVYVGGTTTIGATLTGSGTTTFFGPGAVTLTGTSNAQANVYINGATLSVSAASQLGSTGTFLNGGTLNVTGNSTFTYAGALANFNTKATATIAGGGGVINVTNTGATTFSGAVTATGANGPWTINAGPGANVTFSGVFTSGANQNTTITGAGNVSFTNQVTSGAASGNLIMAGSGTLTLTPAAASANMILYANSGTTVLNGTLTLTPISTVNIDGGTVKFGSAGGVQGSAYTISPLLGGTLDLNGNSGVIGSLAGAQTVGTNLGLVTNNGSAPATLILNNTAAATFNGNIQDGVSQVNLLLNNSGSATAHVETLGGNNTFTGTTTILANIAVTVDGPNALLNSTVYVDNITTATALQFTSGATPDFESFTVGNLAGLGSVTLPGNHGLYQFGNNNQNATFAGPIVTGAAGTVTIAKIGTGTWQLSGNVGNTVVGIYSVNAGTLQLLTPGYFAAGNNLTVAAGAIFDAYGLNQVAFSITGAGNITLGNDPLNALSLTGLTGVSNGVWSGTISGSEGLTKTAASTSTQFITGFNTYTGPTTVNAGNLQLSFTNLTGTNSNLISSSSSALLGANGTLSIVASNAPGSTSQQTFNGFYASPLAGSAATSTLTLASANGAGTLNVTLGSLNTFDGTLLTINMPSVGTNTLNLGTINRAIGSAVNITMPVSSTVSNVFSAATNSLTTSTTGTAGAVLTDSHGTAFAVMNGVDWAAYGTTTSIVPGSTISGFYSTSIATLTAAGYNGSNLDVIGATNSGTVTTLNTIRFNTGAGFTLTLAGPTILTTGGILQTTGVTATNTISGGSLTSTSGEFFIDNTVAKSFVIGPTLGNNGVSGNNTNVTIAGVNVIYLTATNTYSGVTTVLSGATLTLGDNTTTGSINSSSAILNNGSLVIGNTASGNINTSAPITGLGLINVSNPIAAGSPVFATFGGNITINGALSVGTAVANGTATFGGNVFIGGTLTVGGGSGAIIGTATFNGTFESSAAAGIQVGAASGTTNSLTLNGTYSAGNLTTTGTTIITTGQLILGTQTAGEFALAKSIVTLTAATNGVAFGSSANSTNDTVATFGGLAAAAGNLALTNSGPSGGGVALTVFNNAATTYSGILSGAGSLNANGTAALTLSGLNTYTGTTQIQGGGSIVLSFPAAGGTVGILYNTQNPGTANTLTLGGFQTNINNGTTTTNGSLSITTNTTNATTSSQAFSNLILSPSSANLLTFTNATAGSTAVFNLNLTTLQRSTTGSAGSPNSNIGSILLIVPGANGTQNINVTTYPNSGQTGGAVTSNLLDAAGTGFAFYGAAANGVYDLAAVSSGKTGIVAGSSITGFYNTTTVTTAAGANTNWSTNAATQAGSNTAYSITFSNPGAAGAAVAGNTLTLLPGQTTVTTGTIAAFASGNSNWQINGAAGAVGSGANGGSYLVSGSNEFVITTGSGHQFNMEVPLADNPASGGVRTGLTYASANTLAILAVPTYTGPTINLSTGTLSFQFTGGTSSAPLAYSTTQFITNGPLNFGSASGYQIVYAPISGSGSVTQTNNVTTILAPTTTGAAGGTATTNTWSGVTTISGGTLMVGNAGALPINTALSITTGAGGVAANAVLDLGGFSQTIGSLAGSVTGGIAGENIASVTNIITNSGSSNATLTFGALGTNTTFFGTIQDGPTNTTAIVKTGTGSTLFQSTNTFSGGVTITGGSLLVTPPAGGPLAPTPTLSGSASPLTVINTNTGATGTSVVLGLGSNQTVGSLNAGITTVAGNFPTSSAIASFTNTTATIDGQSTFLAVLTMSTPLNGLALGSSITISGGTGAGTYNVYQASGTTVSIQVANNTNTYTGSFTTAPPGAQANGPTLSGYNTTQISLDPGVTLTVNQVSNGLFAGNITGATGSFTLGASSTATLYMEANTVIVGTVAGQATGTLTLTSTNNYGGATTINGGTLSTNLIANGGLASGIGQSSNAASNLVINGGTLQYTLLAGSGANLPGYISGVVAASGATTDRLFTLGTTAGSTIDGSGTGGLIFSNAGLIAFSVAGTNPAGPTLTLTGSFGSYGPTSNNTSNIMTPSLQNNGAAASSLAVTGGVWALAGTSNNYSGNTTISSTATLLGGALNAFSANSTVVINNSGILDLGGFNQTIGGLSSASASSIVETSGIPAATLTIANGNGNSFGGTMKNDGVLSVTLTTGTEILTLGGVGANNITTGSTYTGATTINAGGVWKGGATNTFSPNSPFTLNGTGSLDLGGFSQTILSLASASQTSSVTNSGTSSPAVLSIVNSTNSAISTVYAGTIVNGASTTGLTLSSTGSSTMLLQLSNAAAGNTYSGPTTVNANSTLQVGAASVLSPNSDVTLNGNGTLDLVGSFWAQQVLSLSSSSSTSLVAASGNSGMPTLTISGTTASANYVSATSTVTSTFAGNFAGNAGLTLDASINNVNQSLLLTGTSTTTGAVYVQGTAANTSTLIVNGALGTTLAGGLNGMLVSLGGVVAGIGTVNSGGTVTVGPGGVIRGGVADGTNNYGKLTVNMIGNSLTISSAGTTQSTMGTIVTEINRTNTPSSMFNQFGLGTATTGAGNNSLIVVGGASGQVNLAASPGNIQLKLLDTNSSLVVGESYTINLVQASGGTATTSNFYLNGLQISQANFGSTWQQGPGGVTILDQGTGALNNGATPTGAYTAGTFTTLNVQNNASFANSSFNWVLQLDGSSNFLQLSITSGAVPEPQHILMIVAGVLGLGALIRRRWRARAASAA